MGILEAVTARERADYVVESGDRRQAEVSPLSNYLVGRLRRDFRDGQTFMGAMGTAVNRDLSDPGLAGELRSSAYSGGLDFSHEWADRAWSLSGHFAASRIGGTREVIEEAQTSSARYYQRPDADHLELDEAATSLAGYSANLELSKQAGLHWRGNVELGVTSPGFEVNDLGFQRDADRAEASLRVEYQENRPGETFRRWELNASPEATWNYGGDRLDTNLSLRAQVELLNYWDANLSFENNFESLDDRLTRGGPLALEVARRQVSLSGSSDSRKAVWARLSTRHEWDVAGGRQTSFGVGLGIKPGSTWDLTLSPRVSFEKSAAQYVDTVEDPLATEMYGARYIFADLDQTTFSIETRLNVTFRPDLTLEVYAQPFLASGDFGILKELRAPRTFDFNRYGIDVGDITEVDGEFVIDPDGDGPALPFTIENEDFNRRSLRGTAVLRWEWRPGSTLFLVWQQQRADEGDEGDFQFGRDFRGMLDADPDNIFLVKVSYWFSR